MLRFLIGWPGKSVGNFQSLKSGASNRYSNIVRLSSYSPAGRDSVPIVAIEIPLAPA